MKRVWFFDLDGTLADTDPDIRAAWKATLRDLGIDCRNFDRDFVAGPPIEEMARALLPGVYTDALGARLRAGFGAHYDHDGFVNTFEYPGVMDRVRALKAAGAAVYIATNKRYAGATAMAAKFGWMEVFDGLYTGDMLLDVEPSVRAARLVRAGLPSDRVKLRKPELLRLIMSEIGAVPADCVMVGDTISDFEAAEANGLESVAVAWGYGKPGELVRATRLARTPAEI